MASTLAIFNDSTRWGISPTDVSYITFNSAPSSVTWNPARSIPFLSALRIYSADEAGK